MKHRFVTITLSRAEAAAVEAEIELATLDNNEEAWKTRLLNNACNKLNAANLTGHNPVHAKGGDLVADLANMVQLLLDHDDDVVDGTEIFAAVTRRKAKALVARVWGDPPPAPAERIKRVPGRKPGMRVQGGAA